METEQLDDERRAYTGLRKLIDALLDVDQDARVRMLRATAIFFGIESLISIEGSVSTTTQHEDAPPTFSDREELSPKDFLFQKSPNTDVERVACLAFYLAHYRNVAHFKTTDISKLNTEAAQIKFSNASNAVNNATQSGFLVPASKGAKQLSAPGEKYVDHLPDRIAARKVMSESRPRRRKRGSVKEPTSASRHEDSTK